MVIKRIFDISVASLMIVILIIPMIIIALAIKITSKGPVLYWSKRIGENNTIFRMPKYRSMTTNTPAVATHLLSNSDRYITPLGSILRKSSLDELPQLFCIVKGDMSFVGPRPALFNQKDLMELRTRKGIHSLTPGLTGSAQINGRDELPIPVKVDFDEYYYKHRSFFLDMKILALTVGKVLMREGVTH